MPSTVAAARAAVLDLLGLLEGVKGRIDRAPIRRGRPASSDAWRSLLADRSADAFPRRLAALLRAAKERVGPLRPALRAARPGGPYPSAAAGIQAPTATEYVLAVAEEVGVRIADGLPPSPVRTWMADDEVADLAGRLGPLLASLTPGLATDIGAELDSLPAPDG
jgi:hypothetical protein